MIIWGDMFRSLGIYTNIIKLRAPPCGAGQPIDSTTTWLTQKKQPITPSCLSVRGKATGQCTRTCVVGRGQAKTATLHEETADRVGTGSCF